VLLKKFSTKEIFSVSVSTEAPWHYNGKTSIIPSRYDKEGQAYIKIVKGLSVVEVPLTQAIKNADMADIPHPFGGDLVGKEIIVANPQSDICENLLQIYEAGESVAELFHNNTISIGTTPRNQGFHNSIDCLDISYT